MPEYRIQLSFQSFMQNLSHDILLLIQVVDSQLTEIWHKRSGIVSRAHGIHCHSSKDKVDTLEVDNRLNS